MRSDTRRMGSDGLTETTADYTRAVVAAIGKLR
jgi:hypothetical protein